MIKTIQWNFEKIQHLVDSAEHAQLSGEKDFCDKILKKLCMLIEEQLNETI